MSELGAGLRVPGSNASVRTSPCHAMHVLLLISVAVSWQVQLAMCIDVKALFARRILVTLITPAVKVLCGVTIMLGILSL